MKQFQVFYTLILISTAISSAGAVDYAKKGCDDTCGGVTIPYPFGIGATCSVNQWYAIDCNSSTPYLSAFNHMEVVNVRLEDQTIIVNVSVISRCRNSVGNSNHIPSIDLGASPFAFSGSHNKFIARGCGYAAILNDEKVITGWSTICTNDSALNGRDGCFGLGCCATTSPYDLKSYSVDLTGLKRQGEDGACGKYQIVGNERVKYHLTFLYVTVVPLLKESALVVLGV
ncbi:putative wall-associated receptor kinase, galacturonan-binding domain-containing protein [Helianthus debilis subsp. tardiflorus]